MAGLLRGKTIFKKRRHYTMKCFIRWRQWEIRKINRTFFKHFFYNFRSWGKRRESGKGSEVPLNYLGQQYKIKKDYNISCNLSIPEKWKYRRKTDANPEIFFSKRSIRTRKRRSRSISSGHNQQKLFTRRKFLTSTQGGDDRIFLTCEKMSLD